MQESENLKTIKDFLESSPPGTEMIVRVWTEKYQSGMSMGIRMPLPDLNLHCDSDTCSGDRFFHSQNQYLYLEEKKETSHFLNYYCRNCLRTNKIYAITFKLNDNNSATVYKIGEVPSFGQPTPTRLLTLLDAEKDYFLKGRRAENQGLGIGAFAYYRRAVENQKNRIFDEIIKVAELTKTPPEVIEALRAAQKEPQFSRAVESLKGAIPDSLLIEGHSPLTLLHDALSEGLHAQSDNECLELANTIRTVLSSFAERVSEIRKDQSHLKEAITKLLNRKNK